MTKKLKTLRSHEREGGRVMPGDTFEVSDAEAQQYEERLSHLATPVGGRTSAKSADTSESAEKPAGTDLEELTKAELENLAEERGITVTGSGKDGNVVKADLVAALGG